MPKTLPHGLADGLHLLEPSAFPWSGLLLALLALAGLWWWLRRRRRKPVPPEPAPAPTAKAPSRSAYGIQARIEGLRQQYREDLRVGVHALAAVTREHLEEGLDLPAPQALTALEVSAYFPEAIGRLMLRISDLQWRRREPTKHDFNQACSLAITVLTMTRGRRT